MPTASRNYIRSLHRYVQAFPDLPSSCERAGYEVVLPTVYANWFLDISSHESFIRGLAKGLGDSQGRQNRKQNRKQDLIRVERI